MNKYSKSVVTSLMVLAIGITVAACGQVDTGEENTVRLDNGMNTRDYRRKAATPSFSAMQLANRAEKVPGVGKATVVIHNKEAIVGINVDNSGKKAIIDKQVYAALMVQYPEYNIHVTSEDNLNQKIKSLSDSMANGQHVQQLNNRVAVIIRTIDEAAAVLRR